jgi:hypothetical protein
MSSDQPAGPSVRDWANATLHLKKIETDKLEEAIYELQKRLVINGVEHIQFAWVNQMQLRSVAIDHGL